MLPTMALVALAAGGAVAGLSAGLFGIGGGLVLVPTYLFAFRLAEIDPELAMRLALGTSLTTIVFTGAASVWAHHRRRNVAWIRVGLLSGPLIGGASLGALIAARVPGDWLQSIFGVFICVMAARIALARQSTARPADQADRLGRGPYAELPAVGLGIGAASAVLGIGGGTLTVPYLIQRHVPMHRAVGTAAACGVPLALAASAGYAWAGLGEAGLPPATLGYIHPVGALAVLATSVPLAPVGARLAQRLPAAALRRAFAVVLVAVGGTLLAT